MQYTHLPPKNVDSNITNTSINTNANITNQSINANITNQSINTVITNKTYKTISTTSTTLPIQITITEDAVIHSIYARMTGNIPITSTYTDVAKLIIKDTTNTTIALISSTATNFSFTAGQTASFTWRFGETSGYDVNATSEDGFNHNISRSIPMPIMFVPMNYVISFNTDPGAVVSVTSLSMRITYRTP